MENKRTVYGLDGQDAVIELHDGTILIERVEYEIHITLYTFANVTNFGQFVDTLKAIEADMTGKAY